jgi:putative endonuclease
MLAPRRPYYVYIVASASCTLYVGVTNDLARRMYEHRTKAADGFTAKYDIHHLVWYEVTGNVSAAIAREKQLKGYSRTKKVALIEASNPGWNGPRRGAGAGATGRASERGAVMHWPGKPRSPGAATSRMAALATAGTRRCRGDRVASAAGLVATEVRSFGPAESTVNTG